MINQTTIEYLQEKGISTEDLLNAPKVLRTHCYRQNPAIYDIRCPLCGSSNITWSEFEDHIWCYECEKDILLLWITAGIFGGPIAMELSAMFGIVFDRIEIKTRNILVHKWKFDNDEEAEKYWKIYRATWVKDKELQEYEDVLNKRLEEK